MLCLNSSQAETRAEFAERTVAKLEKSIDDLEGTRVTFILRFWGDLQHLWPKIFFFFNRTCRAQIILSASFKWTCKDAFSFIKWWFICWWTTSTSSYTVAKSLTWVLAWVLEEVSYFSITGIFFLWKRGFSTGTKCMETISLRQANKRPLLLKDKYSMSATKLQRQQRGQNVLIFFFFRSGSFSCWTTGSWVHGFIGSVLWDFHKSLKCSKLPQQQKNKREELWA